jgi:hypothetical protein
MGIFRKKTDPTPIATATTADPVYVMPETYQGHEVKHSILPALLISTLVVVIIVGGSSYLLYSQWSKAQSQIQDAPATIVELNTEPPLIDVATSTAATTTDALTSSTNSGLIMPTSTGSSINANATAIVTVPAADTDADGLTDLEEATIGSAPTNPDSDADTFRDGIELSSGYNPLVAGGAATAKLTAATFLTRFTTDFMDNNLELLVPKLWTARTIPATRQVVITTETGDIIRVSLRGNSQRLSAANWYVQDHPEQASTQLGTIVTGSYRGVTSPNSLQVYLSDDARSLMYVFEYVPSSGNTFNYPALYSLLVLNIRPGATVAPATATTTAANAETSN